jgi:two-component system sensor histidine kinase QseC
VSLRRRLLLYLLLSAPLAWGVALWFSVDRARHEVNELFDAGLIRLARQVQTTLGRPGGEPPAPAAVAEAASEGEVAAALGEADLEDLAIAVWDRGGRPWVADREGGGFPYRPQASGFTELELAGEPWRLYYLQSFDGGWLVAAGQKLYERDEMVSQLTVSQLLPWTLVLPLLLLAMALAVRQTLAPLDRLSGELAARTPDDLHPLPEAGAPTELRPLLAAMNALFRRIDETLARERRFTADAAHELRTPLAALRAQWDVLRRAADGPARAEAEHRLAAGFDRVERLVSQMLALSRLEASQPAGLARRPVAWPAVVEEALSDCLALAERRGITLECEWPQDGVAPLPLEGDAPLLVVLLRNLVDNAVRYAQRGATVTVRLGADTLEVDNPGPPLPPALRARLGERFLRPEGQDEAGSGLGLSIVQRIAALHGLALAFVDLTDADGRPAGVRARLQRAA